VEPTCPKDTPTTPAPNADWRFESSAGDTRIDASGHNFALSSSGSTFINSATYNPAVIVTSSSTAPRPVVPQAAFTVDCSKTVTSDGNPNASTYTWSRVSGPNGSFSATNVAAPTFTPSGDGSLVLRCLAEDAASRSGTLDFNIGVVNSNASGIKIQTNAELGWIIGEIPRYGTSPWPWYEQTEALDAEVLAPYYYAPPAPGTLFTGTGLNNAFFSGRGVFTGSLSDTYDVKISATGAPDSYQWRKNGGAYSAPIPITATSCYGNSNPLTVTDGVIICFGSTTGHTLNDMWTRQAPFEGTGSITASGNNHTDAITGFVCGGASPPCGGSFLTMVGTGTHWSTGTATQKLTAGTSYWFEWDADNDGSNAGRFYNDVISVIDDTHITIRGNATYWPMPVARSASIKIQTVGLDCSVNYTCQGQNANGTLGYYEAILGLVRLAEATNLDIYIQEAQSACSLWWLYGLDHGYNIIIQRNSAWQSMMACGARFGLNVWDGLAYNITYFSTNTAPSPSTRDDGTDIRENSYATRAVALMSHVYPAHTAAPSATRTTWCGYTTNQINNYWLYPWVGSGGRYTLINSNRDAYWQDNPLVFHIAFPISGVPGGNNSSVVFGTSPWRDSGLSNIALIEAYRVLANPADCNNASLGTAVQTATKLSAAFLWDYGRSPDGGLYYNVQYASMQGVRTASDVLHNNPANGNSEQFNITVSGTAVSASAGTGNFTRRFAPCNGTSRIVINGGAPIAVNSCADDDHMTLASSGGSLTTSNWFNDSTIAVTNGSATIVGTRTGFLNMFAPCDGTTYIAIKGITNLDNGVYKVTSCSDDTHLTLNASYGATTQPAETNYALSKKSLSACSPAIGNLCEPIAGGGTALAHDWPISLGQTYQWTGDPLWKNRLEYGLGSIYGGPAGGPSSLGPKSGPQSSLAPANFDEPISSCFSTATVQPCSLSGGDGFLFGHSAKAFGMSAGAGNAPNAIAEYLTQITNRVGTTRRVDTVRQDTVQ
jgi:hypothetical protein